MIYKVFFIILVINNIYLVVCFSGNNSKNDQCSICTWPLLRRKRALTEYTRWYANSDTTQEFIVKVLEDDLPTPRSKPIVAVNIQPSRILGDKIIIGATLHSTDSTPISLGKDYTLFVPPTSMTFPRYGEMFLAPVSPIINNNLGPIKPKVVKGEQHIGPIKTFSGERHGQRDESPPAGPQFIPRSNSQLIKQFAPIAPVVFSQRTSFGPVTPRTEKKIVLHRTSIFPTRTSLYTDTTKPVRTSDFNIFNLDDDPVGFYPTRTSITPTTLKSTISDEEEEIQKSTKHAYSSYYRRLEKPRAKLGMNQKTESDSSYNEDDDDDESIEGTSVKMKHSFAEEYEFDGTSKMENETYEIEQSLTTVGEGGYIGNDNNTGIDLNGEDKDDEDDDKSEITSTTRKFHETIDMDVASKKKGKVKHKKPQCNLYKLRQLSFNAPRTLHEITTQLKLWAEESPVAKLIDITYSNYTVMENPIYMMLVDDLSSGQIMSAKQTVMIVAGIQGRDHHAVAAAMYLLYQLVDRSDTHSDLLSKFRFWIIPVFNPDGYDYSMTFPKRREWSKNLRQTWDSCKGRDSCVDCSSYGLRCKIQPCYGVNLDRNFEYQWIPHDELKAEHACGSLYSGQRQLSEAETRALTRFLHEQRTPLYTFIAFKEGDVLGVMYPYSHTKKKRAFDHVYKQRASRAASAAYSISTRPYVAGQTSEFLPLYAGGIEDWVDGHLGIDNTYTVMMYRPTDSYNSKLITERVVHEAYAAVHTLLLQSVEPFGPPPVILTRSSGCVTQASNLIAFCPALIILLYY